MTVEEAKKILSDSIVTFPQHTTDALKIVLSELENLQNKFESSVENFQEFLHKDIMNLPNEIWCDIINYEGLYKISNLGRVKSLYLEKELIIKPKKRQQGYCYVTLFNNGVKKDYTLHILVAKTFIPNPDKKPFVNHKDGNKQNNSVENLEWVTPSENMKHAYKIGLCKSGANNKCAKFDKETVDYIRTVYKRFDKNFGIKALAKKFNVGVNTIRRIVTGESYKDDSYHPPIFFSLSAENVKYIRENYIPKDKKFGCRPLAKLFNVKPAAISKVICGRTHIEI